MIQVTLLMADLAALKTNKILGGFAGFKITQYEEYTHHNKWETDHQYHINALGNTELISVMVQVKNKRRHDQANGSK
jgi:hypothetical protein